MDIHSITPCTDRTENNESGILILIFRGVVTLSLFNACQIVMGYLCTSKNFDFQQSWLIRPAHSYNENDFHQPFWCRQQVNILEE